MKIISNKNNKDNKKKFTNKHNIKFLIGFFGVFITITVTTIVYKIPVQVINISNDNVTKIVVEGKFTHEYLSIEDKNTINSVIKSFEKEKFIRQNLGTKYRGYNIYIYFYQGDDIIETLLIHSDNLLQKNSMVYKLPKSKAIKNILNLLEESLKARIIN